MNEVSFVSSYITISADQKQFFRVDTKKGYIGIECPAFEINKEIVDDFCFVGGNDGGCVKSIVYTSKSHPELELTLELKMNENSPFVRFRYKLSSSDLSEYTLTKKNGKDNITYFAIKENTCSWDKLYEYQFSQYIPHIHSFVPQENVINISKLRNCMTLVGPSLRAIRDGADFIIGYEHGAECPNHYLHFDVSDAALEMKASKGNYYDGFVISEKSQFVSCWFHIGAVDFEPEKPDEICNCYREFFLKFMSRSKESRKPYIFYNTWNYQERDHCFKHTPFLERMNLDKILCEIDAAHKIGIEYFVLDTGWYGKTGDWLVNLERFPDGLSKVKEKLDGYGMKLGLWFNPTVAARTSEFVTEHPEYIMSIDGKAKAEPIWETEESYGMCLCSDYAPLFAKKLIDLYKTIGVRYFKWDGISQFGCNSPHHNHGNENNTPEERAECYSYQMGLSMINIVEELLDECPDAIVDFDITEAGRFVGLGFLSVGKYFLVNNGPYAKDLDIPEHYHCDKVNTEVPPYTNVFFYPGVARPRFCRTGIKYDKLVPSTLFLTHYFPDGDDVAQANSVASLVLGGNGIWGDLEALEDRERDYIKNQLELYKKVREESAQIPAITTGTTGASPEIYEKINPETGIGFVSIFTCQAGEYDYITEKLSKAPTEIVGADSFEILPDGAVRIHVKLEKDMARVVYFIR